MSPAADTRLKGATRHSMNVGDIALMDRFVARVYVMEDGCWEWLSALDTGGYAKIAVPPRGTWDRAHRVAYRLFVGPIPVGKQLDHLCRRRSCVNPSHLEAVSARENTLRGDGVAGRYARRTHCEHGHEFSPENTYTVPGSNARRCRICQRRRTRESEQRRRAAA